LALVEVSVVEQRYRAVLEVKAGVPVTEAAARAGVSRQSVHAWVRRYEQGGLGALADRPKPSESRGEIMQFTVLQEPMASDALFVAGTALAVCVVSDSARKAKSDKASDLIENMIASLQYPAGGSYPPFLPNTTYRHLFVRCLRLGAGKATTISVSDPGAAAG
jgi:transposase-like protein